MRQIILLTLFAAFCCVPAFGQKEKPAVTDTSSVPSEHKGPRFHMPSPEAYRFRIHPKDSLHNRKMPRLGNRWSLPGDSIQPQMLAERRLPMDHMPVVIFPQHDHRMPIYKPGPRIDYKLKIKRLGAFPQPLPPEQ